MSKHTKTPWVATVEVSDCGGWKSPEQLVTISSGETIVAHYAASYCEFPSDEENTANAAFIVRAVNAHEGLVRALASIAEDCRRGAHEHGMTPAGVQDIASRCDAALSAAKE